MPCAATTPSAGGMLSGVRGGAALQRVRTFRHGVRGIPRRGGVGAKRVCVSESVYGRERERERERERANVCERMCRRMCVVREVSLRTFEAQAQCERWCGRQCERRAWTDVQTLARCEGDEVVVVVRERGSAWALPDLDAAMCELGRCV